MKPGEIHKNEEGLFGGVAGSDTWMSSYYPLIHTCMKNRHGTPFEQGLMTLYMELPMFVWWELTRHRFMGLEVEDFSFNLESSRYKVLQGQMYLPPRERPMMEPEGFKPMRPQLNHATDGEYEQFIKMSKLSAQFAWETYDSQVKQGYARELARMNLPFNIYFSGYVEAKPRTWLTFFSLRCLHTNSRIKSFAQYEIEQVCKQAEAYFEWSWPLTYKAFNECGRDPV